MRYPDPIEAPHDTSARRLPEAGAAIERAVRACHGSATNFHDEGPGMLRRLYDRILALSASPRAPWWLAAIAFAESSFFPIPPDVLLIPMVLARPRRAWLLASVCTAASVLGGALGYYIGYALFNQVARGLIDFYHYGPAFDAFQATFAKYGLWVILVKGLTPIPYKIVTIASGAARFDFPLFMLASVITRGSSWWPACCGCSASPSVPSSSGG
jgi:membrane protein YqaA with SNARE-associated domain